MNNQKLQWVDVLIVQIPQVFYAMWAVDTDNLTYVGIIAQSSTIQIYMYLTEKQHVDENTNWVIVQSSWKWLQYFPIYVYI